MSKSQALSEVNKKIEALEYKNAYTILESILKHTPNDKYVKKKIKKVKDKIIEFEKGYKVSKNERSIHDFTNLYNNKQYQVIINNYNKTLFNKNYIILNIVGSAYKAINGYQNALNFYSESISQNSNFLPSLFNRGIVYFEIKDFKKAYQDFTRAYNLETQNHLITYYLGCALEELKETAEAEKFYNETIKIKKDFEDVYLKLADLNVSLGKYNDAIKLLKELIKINNSNSIAHYNLGNILEKNKSYNEAIKSFEDAIEINPSFFQAYLNAAILIHKHTKKTDQAAKYFKKSISINPGFDNAFSNYSSFLSDMGNFEDAFNNSQEALKLKPKNSKAYYNKGIALNGLGYIYDAIENYQNAIKFENIFYDSFFNKSLCQLLLGNFELGWVNYEYRKKRSSWVERGFKFPELTSKEQINGSTILIYCEQGLGDTIQFSRYIKSFVELGAEVIFEVQRPLVGLFKLFDGIKIIAKGDHISNVDYQLPIMSCGKIFNTNLSNIPVPIEINEDHDLTTEWKEKLDNGKKDLRIGVVWEGSKNHEDDKKVTKLKRSFPLETLVEKLAIPGIRLISLQRDHKKLDEKINTCLETLGDDFDKKEYAFKDSIAVMRNLDLVISCDTSIAHLAGTLNVPNWIALKYVPDWRWQLVRNDSPWYASTKLFRQPEWGDWDTVFDQMKTIIQKEFLI